ncbi:MAG: hypothetical protein ACJAVK_003081 [Akkermansiaceae bacterium]|jgi:hypothetical protein
MTLFPMVLDGQKIEKRPERKLAPVGAFEGF